METEELVELIRLVGCEVLVKRRETPSRREKAKKFAPTRLSQQTL